MASLPTAFRTVLVSHAGRWMRTTSYRFWAVSTLSSSPSIRYGLSDELLGRSGLPALVPPREWQAAAPPSETAATTTVKKRFIPTSGNICLPRDCRQGKVGGREASRKRRET